jgi:hypothetical protein
MLVKGSQESRKNIKRQAHNKTGMLEIVSGFSTLGIGSFLKCAGQRSMNMKNYM